MVDDKLQSRPEQSSITAKRQSTALAHPNIAFIKYWGNTDDTLRLPANSSLSMNLGSLHTITTVTFDDNLPGDQLLINNAPVTGAALARVTAHLNLVRSQARLKSPARVESTNNFPIGSGIASSAAAFAALSVAAASAAGLSLDEAALSRLARRGSGSASRSIPDGYCQWVTGSDETSFATSIAPASSWDLRDIIVVASQEHKPVGSSDGHRLAKTASLQAARVAGAEERLKQCREALLARNLAAMGPVIEEDAVMMHAVMMSSRPPLYYWNTVTMDVIQATQHWRAGGLPVYFTIDAGPNVHLICEAPDAKTVEAEARQIPGVENILLSGPGGAARLVKK
ncbi:MAG: diphosphomevalonate decarboxylase [Anaerolineae bacterium]|nr:diphosphomevalonate decarboxylase [Anaerolineae bacterium]